MTSERKKKLVRAVVVLATVVFGIVFVFYNWFAASNQQASYATEIAEIMADGLRGEMIKQLQGRPGEEETMAYESIKNRLINFVEVDPYITFIYLYTQRDGRLYFMADSEPENSPNISLPGDEYFEASNQYTIPFSDPQTFISKPARDRWGTWISVLSPMKDRQTGEIFAVLGIDYTVADWNRNAIRRVGESFVVLAIIYALVITLFVFFTRIDKSRRKFLSLVRNIPGVVFRCLLDKDWTMEYMSADIKKMTGYPPSDFINSRVRTYTSVIHPADKDMVDKTIREAIAANNPYDIEYRLLGIDKKIVWVKEKGQAVYDNKNRPSHLEGVIYDNSQEKKFISEIESKNKSLETARQATTNLLEDLETEKKNISRERDRINAILQSIGDAVFVVNRELEIVIFNKTAVQLSGYTQAEAIGKKYDQVLKFVYEADKNKVNRDFIDQALSTGEVQSLRNHTLLISKKGDEIPVADSAAPLKNEDGEVIGCVVVFHDVSVERQVDRMKTEFVSVASHQLRTPLSAVKWFLELVINGDFGKLNDLQTENLKEAFRANQRSINLVNDLLNVSRIESGRLTIDPKPTDLRVLVEDVKKEMVSFLKARQQEIKITVPADLPKISIDPRLIREVIDVLLSNASRYSDVKSSIEVLFQFDEKDILVEVKDNGFGIPLEQQAKIFAKFFRADNAVTKVPEGTGMGLYVAKSIVEASGGKIWFKSQEGQGTSFYFTLPLAGSPRVKGEKSLA